MTGIGTVGFLRCRAADLFFASALVVVLIASSALPALAQFIPAPAAPTPSLPTDATQVDSYVARLDDGAARALLIDQLRAGAENSGAQKKASTLGAVALAIKTVRDGGSMAIGRIQDLREAIGDFDAQSERVVLLMSDLQGWPAVRDSLAIDTAILLATVVLVWIASLVFGRLAGSRAVAPLGSVAALTAVGARLLGAFVIANLLILSAYTSEDPLRELPTALALWGTLIYAVYSVSTHCGAIHRAAVTLAAAFALFGALGQGVLQIYGLREELNAIFLAIVGTIAFAILLPIAGALIPRAPFKGLRETVDGWVMARPFVVVIWLVWLVDVLAGRDAGATAAVIALLCIAGLGHMRIAGINQVVAEADATVWRPAWARPVEIALSVLAIFVAAQALGADLVGYLGTPAGQRLVAGAIDSALITIIALCLWSALRRWIDRRVGDDVVDEGASTGAVTDGEGGTAKVGTRAQTLLPLIRSIAAMILIVLVSLTMLSSFGIDITPLLAGAGIIGIAVGFGAQSLVRDVFSGIFFLIDDAFRIGEYIEFGEIRGEVEHISIRSLTLRHHRGAIHTVPFGEIRAITNYNRDWVIMKLRFTLRFDTDVFRVKKLIKVIGAEMMADPEHGPNLLEPPKSQGILEFTETGVILRVKFKCKPREQFVLRRVLNERLMAEFTKAGIRFAFPTVTVERPSTEDADDGAEAVARAVLAAPVEQV